MKKILFFTVLFFSFVALAQKEGQARIDSLLTVLPKMKEDTLKVATLNDLSAVYQNIDPDEGLRYGRNSLALAEKLHWKDGITLAYKNIGVNYFIASNFPLALQNYDKALVSCMNEKIKGNILNNISLVYTFQCNYSKGLEYAFQALKIRESLHDLDGITVSYTNIGMLYYNMGNTATAIAYYKKALQTNEKIKNQLGMTRILMNLGHVYSDLNQSEKAIECYQRGMKISAKIGDNLTKAKYLAAIADCYLDQKKYALALQFCNESLHLTDKENGDDFNTAFCTSLMGAVYFEMAKEKNNDPILLEKAQFNYSKSLKFYKILNNLKFLSYNYEQLSDIDALMGNYKSALEAHKLGVVYRDSIFNADNKETIKNLEDKRTIELRDKQIQLNRLTIESKEKQKWYFIFGILSLLVIGSLLFYQSRNRKKVNKKLLFLNNELDQSNKTKARFFSILNHDLRSPVANLIHFLHLQKGSPELLDQESKLRMENKTILGAENLLNSMEDILLWSKGQMENFQPKPKKITIDSIFEDTKNHFSSEENILISFENSQDIQLFTDENYLKTILRNLTGNAIKALEKSTDAKIVWKAWQENGQHYLSIKDNGFGAAQEQFKALYDDTEVVGIKTGLGLHLIRDLAKAIDCKIEVESLPNEGTTFTLTFDQ